jgi:hypothetical protein
LRVKIRGKRRLWTLEMSTFERFLDALVEGGDKGCLEKWSVGAGRVLQLVAAAAVG